MIVYAINASNCKNFCYTDEIEELNSIILGLIHVLPTKGIIQISKREISKEEFDQLEPFGGFLLNG